MLILGHTPVVWDLVLPDQGPNLHPDLEDTLTLGSPGESLDYLFSSESPEMERPEGQHSRNLIAPRVNDTKTPFHSDTISAPHAHWGLPTSPCSLDFSRLLQASVKQASVFISPTG